MAVSALLIARDLLADPQAPALTARLALAGVQVVPVDLPATAKALRLALTAAGATEGWLLARDPEMVSVAATAALIGVVLIGVPAPIDDDGIVVGSARDLADAPRVMVPRGGGCWHDHRQA